MLKFVVHFSKLWSDSFLYSITIFFHPIRLNHMKIDQFLNQSDQKQLCLWHLLLLGMCIQTVSIRPNIAHKKGTFYAFLALDSRILIHENNLNQSSFKSSAIEMQQYKLQYFDYGISNNDTDLLSPSAMMACIHVLFPACSPKYSPCESFTLPIRCA